MPEEIRVNTEIERGFVGSRPAPGKLDALRVALQGVKDVRSGVERFQAREAAEVEDLLSSPLVTENEAQEIRDSAITPLAKLRAENRQGELIVQREVESLQDAISNAPDAIEARKILRQRQQELLDAHGDEAGIASGIRERFADVAPNLLGEASARRIATRERQERLAVDEDLRLNLESSGALGYVNTLIPHLTDEALTGGDVDGILADAAIVLENHWKSGDDVEDPDGNVNTVDSLESIDILLEDIPLDAKQRKAFTDLRQRIQSGEEAARRARATSDKPAKDAAHAQAQQDIINWIDANPDQPLPPQMTRRLIASGDTAAKKRAAREWLKDQAPPLGVVNTEIWEQGRTQLRAQAELEFEASIDFDLEDNVSPADILAVYESLGARLDPALADDPAELRRVRENAIAEATVKAKERVDLRRQTRQDRVAQTERFTVEYQRRIASGDREGAARLANVHRESIIEVETRAFTQQIDRWALEMGYTPFDMVQPLE